MVEMSSPDLPDLTLIDLPGIVRTSTAGQTDAVIRDVNNLIQDYLNQARRCGCTARYVLGASLCQSGLSRSKRGTASAPSSADVIAAIHAPPHQERTVILCVIPANQDISTIDILERAHKVDPSGDRTIGVLTKPDLINPGGEDEVSSWPVRTGGMRSMAAVKVVRGCLKGVGWDE